MMRLVFGLVVLGLQITAAVLCVARDQQAPALLMLFALTTAAAMRFER